MQYLEKNYVVFDNNSKVKEKYELGQIKNKTNDLQKIFGNPVKQKNGINKWKFKMDTFNFTIYDNKDKKEWYLSTNTDNKQIIKNFFLFLSEANTFVNSSRSTHKYIPIYTPETYQLKGKISLYRVPPIKPPSNIIIYEEMKNIPKKNKYGELIFKDFPDFKPNLTPKEVIQAGSFGGTYYRPILSGITGKYYKDEWKEFPEDWFEGLDIEQNVTSIVIRSSINKYKSKMGGNLDMWESCGWITKIDPYGWFQWYCRFYLGRRTTDDNRQISRWLNVCGPNGRFRITLIKSIIREKTKYNDYKIKPVVRQGMLHWSYELTKKDFDDYIKKLLNI